MKLPQASYFLLHSVKSQRENKQCKINQISSLIFNVAQGQDNKENKMGKDLIQGMCRVACNIELFVMVPYYNIFFYIHRLIKITFLRFITFYEHIF